MGDGYNLDEVLLWELYRSLHRSHYKLFYFNQNPRPKNNRENFSSVTGGSPWPLITHLSEWPSSTHPSSGTAWLCIVSGRLKASLGPRLPAEMEALATFMLPIGVGTYLTCFIFNWYSLLCFLKCTYYTNNTIITLIGTQRGKEELSYDSTTPTNSHFLIRTLFQVSSMCRRDSSDLSS